MPSPISSTFVSSPVVILTMVDPPPDNSIRMNTTGDTGPAVRQLGQVTRVIRFNAFDMNCVAHQSPGLWRHPEDQSWRYKDLTYWTELAKLLERGRFDGLFIAD